MMVPDGLVISSSEWAIVRNILLRHVPEREIWAFGSRATAAAAKPFSDLDLVICGDKPLSLGTHADLVEEFTESDLPWKVDLVEWATASEAFRGIIERSHVVLLQGSPS